ncbi:MAG: DUF4097 family beta strand repeat protein [Caldilineaceae bacterium]|nr:DUF4097 family beta strand repeat protein [Caldilineaceae bacterium]
MNQERLAILQQLAEGKVTVDEATNLLQARQPSMPSAPMAAPDALTSSLFQLGDWLRRFGERTANGKVEESFDCEIDGANFQAIAVQSVNGDVSYTGADQTTFVIHARKVVKAPDQAMAEAFASQVQVRVEPKAGTLQVYADYPKPPRQVSVQVTFTIQGPHALTVEGQSTNGQVAIREVTGQVKAQSTNGEVQVTAITGGVEAKSTNGSVQAHRLVLTTASSFASQNGAIQLEVQQGQPPMTATTVNGSVQVALPVDYQGQIEARTQNGEIQTALPIRVTHRTRNQLRGQIGSGSEALLKLQSQNGTITVTHA